MIIHPQVMMKNEVAKILFQKDLMVIREEDKDNHHLAGAGADKGAEVSTEGGSEIIVQDITDMLSMYELKAKLLIPIFS